MRMSPLLILASLALALLATGARAADTWPALDTLEVDSGLALVLGDHAGQAAVDLAASGRFVVRVLAPTETGVAAARKVIADAGQSYLASVAQWRASSRLPLAEETVNLLLADLDALGSAAPDPAEIERVLVPGVDGVAWIKKGGTWQAVRRPMPAAYDGWEQYFYDAQGSDCSQDTAVAVPDRLRYLHSYVGTSSNGLRFSGGRMVYERVGQGLDRRFDPTHQDLVARDAFNGLPRWVQTRPANSREGRASSQWKHKPLILHDDTLFIMLLEREGERLTRIDARSGEILGPVEGSLEARANPAVKRGSTYGRSRPIDLGEVVLEGDTLYQVIGNQLAVIDRASGQRRWLFTAEDMAALHSPRVAPDLGLIFVIAAAPDAVNPLGAGKRWPGVYGFAGYQGPHGNDQGRDDTLQVLALETATGKERWRVPFRRAATSFAYRDGRLVYMSPIDNGGYPALGALDAATGKTAWDYEPKQGRNGNPWKGSEYGYDFSGQVKTMTLVADRVLLTGNSLAIFDLLTGEQQAMAPLQYNSRCEQGRSTTELFCAPFSRFVDIGSLDQAEPALRFTQRIQARGSCAAGYWPAYGSLHYLGTNCLCANFLRANLAVRGGAPTPPVAADQRLVKGPAFGAKPNTAIPGPEDWPVWLGTQTRNALAASRLPAAELAEVWSVQVAGDRPAGLLAEEPAWAGFAAGRIEAPVVAGGLAVAVDRDAHTLVAHDAATGAEIWRFTAEARILTAPTLIDGWCVFGARDGWAYCLRAADGVLAWRRLVAPDERQIVVHGQLESTHPLTAALPVIDGKVIVLAGHTPMLDGGLIACRLDLATGAEVWRKPIAFSPDWQPLAGTGRGLVEDARATNSIDDATNRAGNLVRGGPLAVVDDFVIGDGLAFDHRHGELRFPGQGLPLTGATGRGKSTKQPEGPSLALVFGSNQLHERYGRANDESAVHAQPIRLSVGGAKKLIELDSSPAFDDTVLAVVDSGVAGLVPRSGLSGLRGDAGGLLDERYDLAIWRTKLTDERHFRGQVTALALTADELVISWREQPGRSDTPLHPSPGHLLRLRRADGSEIQRLAFASAPMRGGLAIANGKLYVVCEDGSLHCFQAGA